MLRKWGLATNANYSLSAVRYVREVATNIAKIREGKGISQVALAERLGMHVTSLNRLERGKTSASTNRLQQIARELGVSMSDLVADNDEFGDTVPLVGYVGAGAAAHYYGDAPGELDRVSAPKNATRNTVAVEIRGESLGPVFANWLVFYDDVRSPVTSDMIGILCVVGLPDDRVLVKRIKQSRTPGFFHLESNTEPTILDVEILWAAKVRSIEPRWI